MNHGDLAEGPLPGVRLRAVVSAHGVALVNAPMGLFLLAPTAEAWERLGFAVVAHGDQTHANAAV